jgi:hypothetical protein
MILSCLEQTLVMLTATELDVIYISVLSTVRINKLFNLIWFTFSEHGHWNCIHLPKVSYKSSRSPIIIFYTFHLTTETLSRSSVRKCWFTLQRLINLFQTVIKISRSVYTKSIFWPSSIFLPRLGEWNWLPFSWMHDPFEDRFLLNYFLQPENNPFLEKKKSATRFRWELVHHSLYSIDLSYTLHYLFPSPL